MSCEILVLFTILSFQENTYTEHVEFCAQLLREPPMLQFLNLGNNSGFVLGQVWYPHKGVVSLR